MCSFTREPNENDAINSRKQRDKYAAACQTTYAPSQYSDYAISRYAGLLCDNDNTQIVDYEKL